MRTYTEPPGLDIIVTGALDAMEAAYEREAKTHWDLLQAASLTCGTEPPREAMTAALRFAFAAAEDLASMADPVPGLSAAADGAPQPDAAKRRRELGA